MTKKIVLSALAILLVIAGLGMYKFNFLASQEGYDADGNKISLLQKIDECKESGFQDYAKEMTDQENGKFLNSLKTTENSEILTQNFCSQNRAWRAYIAENTHTPTELLWYFSDEEDGIVRQYLAANRNLPADIGEKLSNDTNIILRVLARNPATPETVLIKIWKKPANLQIQQSLAYNRGASDKFQQDLAKKLSDVKALKELAKNPEISQKTREILKERNLKEIDEALEKNKISEDSQEEKK